MIPLHRRLSGLVAAAAVLSLNCPPSASVAVGQAAPSGSLPGAGTFAPDLREKLALAVRAKGPDYVPRTRHRNEDASARFTNRLILESSPYLIQHAHNPVNWYPWGDEAFQAAARLGRPVLLSIGYSTCHWCHVMEEESFEDLEIAEFLNANYIAVKVDREERPDVDAIYMSAVQMLTGRGGWPMTTWLTPERRPFFGGTYFPARDGDRGSRKGFLTLIREMKQIYDERPETVADRATQIVASIRSSLSLTAGEDLPQADVLRAAARGYAAGFDATDGGIGRAPKFPSSLPVRFLLREYRNTGDPQLLHMATLTLEKMAGGGMYDQVGGGFHRYSTDRKWLVPHFEKMLYDNALLTLAYLEGYQVTGNERFADVAREILRYVGREMTAAGGAFYSATDADSLNPAGEREEGWFFTWTPAEIRAALDPASARLVETYYGVTEEGNFEGRNILNVARQGAEVARQLELPAAEFRKRLDTARDKLYAIRSKRPAPLLDDKILAAWNGLMIQAFARAGRVLDEPRFVASAAAAARFVLEHMVVDDRLRRTFHSGTARHNGYAEDYAFLIAGLLDLYEASAEIQWLREAMRLQSTLDKHYSDPTSGGYFTTSDDHEALLAREKPTYDGAEPTANSVALMNLLRLSEWTTNDVYRKKADALLRAYAEVLNRSPHSLSEMLLGLDFRHGSPKEIVIVTPGAKAGAESLLRVLRSTFLPNAVTVVASQGRDLELQSKLVPLLEHKVARKGEATAYVCRGGVCRLPTSDPVVFRKQLEVREASTGGSTIPRKK